jgi:hypothetical protein
MLLGFHCKIRSPYKISYFIRYKRTFERSDFISVRRFHSIQKPLHEPIYNIQPLDRVGKSRSIRLNDCIERYSEFSCYYVCFLPLMGCLSFLFAAVVVGVEKCCHLLWFFVRNSIYV